MSSDTNPIRILSVDDHPLIRQGVAGLVATQADMNLIAEATNGREAIQQFHRHRPDITLMDLQMPEMNGLVDFTILWPKFQYLLSILARAAPKRRHLRPSERSAVHFAPGQTP